jgi:hypothetical protein
MADVAAARLDPYAGHPVDRRRAILGEEILRLQDQRYRHELTIGLCDALPEELRTMRDMEERHLAAISIRRLDIGVEHLHRESHSFEQCRLLDS